MEFFRANVFCAWNSSRVKGFKLGICHSLEFLRGITIKNMYPRKGILLLNRIAHLTYLTTKYQDTFTSQQNAFPLPILR